MYRLRAAQVTCSFLFCCMFPYLKHCVSMCYRNTYKTYTLDNFFFVFKLDPFCNSCAAPDLVTQSLLLSVSSSQVMQKLALSVHSVTAKNLNEPNENPCCSEQSFPQSAPQSARGKSTSFDVGYAWHLNWLFH